GIYIDDDDDPENDNFNITLKRLEISKCGGEGIKGGAFDGLLMEDLNLYENDRGETDYWHNIYLSGSTNITVRQTTLTSGGLTNSPNGHGIRLSNLTDVYLENLRVEGNADHGIHMTNVIGATGVNLKVEGNCADPNGGCQEVGAYTGSVYDFEFAND